MWLCGKWRRKCLPKRFFSSSFFSFSFFSFLFSFVLLCLGAWPQFQYPYSSSRSQFSFFSFLLWVRGIVGSVQLNVSAGQKPRMPFSFSLFFCCFCSFLFLSLALLVANIFYFFFFFSFLFFSFLFFSFLFSTSIFCFSDGYLSHGARFRSSSRVIFLSSLRRKNTSQN